ncbi:MAG: efflux RND transporter periplasmic adaptor subunit [candidate division Zixibacteria bacterium]|nr:efflux RND transporter periplasmic adaptor subunit [Candidatus Tariuqbacter arcticus]
MLNFNHKRFLIFAGAAGIIILLIIAVVLIKDESTDLPSAEIQYGDFVIELTATGEIKAAKSINISAPRVRTNLQIVKIAPEGSIVDSGDFLVQFDTDELSKMIEEKQSELEIAQANLEKSAASMQANMAQLQSALENTQASYELAVLRLEQMAFEADVKVQEEKLRLRQSEISLKQSKVKIESQKTMDAAETRTLQLKIEQAQAELSKSKRQVKQMTVTAPAPGLVVYQKMWRGGSGMEKIKIGDIPWRGQSLIQLPDLSKMQVTTEISEIDIGKLEKGQSATIKLDAFPDPTFTGSVTDIASLAHEKDGQNDIKVFDIIIDINEVDKILKPGMTAKSTILIKTIPDQMFVPIEAVFEKEGKKVVYLLDGKPKPVEVTPGRRNDNFVTIQADLEAGDHISLVDPMKSIQTSAVQKESASPEILESEEQ